MKKIYSDYCADIMSVGKCTGLQEHTHGGQKMESAGAALAA